MLRITPPIELSRRHLLKGVAAFSASVLFSGCNGAMNMASSAATQQAAAGSQPLPGGPVTQALLNVTASSSASIGDGFAGLSYEKSALCGALFAPSNTNLVGLFKLLGPSVLRIGGNSVDRCAWQANGAGRTTGQIAPSDVAAVAAFIKETGWQCIYGINLGGAATGATTPELAAAEVAYVAEQFGSSLLGIEIGNECDGYGGSGSFFANNWSLSRFESLWMQFRDAILAVTPGVPITGPASASNVSTWTVPFGKTMTRANLSLLTQHYYRGDGLSSSSTVSKLLSSDTNLNTYLGSLSTGSKSVGIPFRLGECNSYYDGGAPGISNAYASSLWVIDFLFNNALGGAAGVNLHGGGTVSYSPIADKAGAVAEVRPEFYGMTLFTMAGQGDVYQTSLSAGSLNVTAYAVKTSTGGLNLVMVNKDSTQNLDLTATLPSSVSKATLMQMTQLSDGASGPDLSATSGVTIQGAGINTDGSFSPSAPYELVPSGKKINCYVPALSAVLVQTT
jgi:hypothetical protein